MDEVDSVLDVVPCGIMQTSSDGMIRRVNRTFCGWVGRRAEELVGVVRFQDLMTVGARIFHHTHWAPLLRMQGSISEVKLELRHANGTTFPLVLNAALRDLGGGVLVHDIAGYVARDRDRYEQELVQSRRRLETLVAELNELHAAAKDRALFAEQMIGIVSHDLRNPLSAIAMGTTLLSSKSGEQTRIVDRMNRAVERANRLIVDLLDFTQARLGRGLAIAVAPISVHDVIADAIEELRMAYRERKIVHCRRGDGGCVADPNRIVQLVGNLVSNAVAYGSRDVPITVTTATHEGGCSIEVHNMGAPIAAAMLPTLFEPMTRGHADGLEKRSVGLGLYIVREIARAHGGSASATSSAEAGTTFRIELGRPSA